jgi:hypothetical protein
MKAPPPLDTQLESDTKKNDIPLAITPLLYSQHPTSATLYSTPLEESFTISFPKKVTTKPHPQPKEHSMPIPKDTPAATEAKLLPTPTLIPSKLSAYTPDFMSLSTSLDDDTEKSQLVPSCLCGSSHIFQKRPTFLGWCSAIILFP